MVIETSQHLVQNLRIFYKKPLYFSKNRYLKEDIENLATLSRQPDDLDKKVHKLFLKQQFKVENKIFV